MIQQFSDQIHDTKTCAVLSQTGEYLLLFTGEGALNVASMAKSAPKYSKITYIKGSNVSNIFKNSEFDELYGLVEKFAFRRLDLAMYNQMIKEVQAQLANAGFDVLQVYGIKVNSILYGYDIGFEFRFNESTSFFVDFYLVHEDERNHQLTLGYDLESKTKMFTNEVREFGSFTDGNTFTMKFPNSTPQMIIDLLGSIAAENVSYLPNLSILIDNIYSDMNDNSFRIFKANSNNELSCVCAGCLVDSSSVATRTREKGASLFKKVATDERAASGISSVASMKILSAAVIESLGNIMLIETVKNGVTEAKCDYIEAKEQFISQKVAKNSLLNSIAWNAEYIVNQLGVARVISEDKLSYLLKNLIGQQVSLLSNRELHLITSSAGDTVGFLSAGNKNVIYENITQIDKGENSKLLQLEVKDNILTNRQISNIAVDSVNVAATEKDIQAKINLFESKCAAINFNDMQEKIAELDELVVRNFNSLASLQASSKVLSAKAKTILKAVDNILKFPMKTGYSAQNFGCLAEFIDINNNQDGTSTVSIIEGNYVPYYEELSEYQCGTKWITRNPDPGRGYENDILVGSTYAASINDLKGKKVSVETKEYIITDRQTRGSGKCEQEVVRLTKTEARVVTKMNKFLGEIVQILTNLLNDETMISMKQITRAISDVTKAVKNYNQRRVPYQKKLIEYFDAQNKLFFYNNAKKLITDYYVFSSDLFYSSEFSYCEAEYDDEELRNLVEVVSDADKGVINRITKAIVISDACVHAEYGNIQDAKLELINKAKITKQIYSDVNEYCLSLISSKSEFLTNNKVEIIERNNLQEPDHVDDPGMFTIEEPQAPENADESSSEYAEYLERLATYNEARQNYIEDREHYEAYVIEKAEFDERLNSVLELYLRRVERTFTTFGDVYSISETESIGLDNFNQQGFVKSFSAVGYSLEDFNFDSVLNTIDEFQLQCRALNEIYIENKNRIKSTISNYKIKFDGREIATYDSSSNESMSFYIDCETYTIKYKINSSYNEENKTMSILVTPESFKKKEGYGDTSNITVSVGSLSYELSNLLKHEFIFGVLPIEQTILDKISYSLLQRTEASVEEVYNVIKNIYGESIAQYYSGYANKIGSLNSFFGCLIFSAIARIDLFATTMMAFQEQNLGIVMQEKGLKIGNSSSFADEVVSIRI